MNDEDRKLVFDTLEVVGKDAGVRVVVIAFVDTPDGRAHCMASDSRSAEALQRVLFVSRRELLAKGIPS